MFAWFPFQRRRKTRFDTSLADATVRALQLNASAACASLQLGPPASILSSTFACLIFRAAALPLLTNSVSDDRSSSVSRTTYLIMGASLVSPL
jgi:hypothetical protein